MSETKMYLLSAFVSLSSSALIYAVFLYADNSKQIYDFALKANQPVYLKSQEQMNKEMAEIMLPMLEKQHKDDAARNKIKKPTTVYAPEQLQNSKGY